MKELNTKLKLFTFSEGLFDLILLSVLQDIQPKRDLSRFVKWPKYIRLQRQKVTFFIFRRFHLCIYIRFIYSVLIPLYVLLGGAPDQAEDSSPNPSVPPDSG
jgi:hypothetical protein